MATARTSPNTTTTQMSIRLILIGDSDISRWPKDLLPTSILIPSTNKIESSSSKSLFELKEDDIVDCSKSGALLRELSDQVQMAWDHIFHFNSSNSSCTLTRRQKQKMKQKHDGSSKRNRDVPNKKSRNTSTDDNDDDVKRPILLFLACAGENDISYSGNSTDSDDTIISSLERAVHSIFSTGDSRKEEYSKFFLLLGPKVEPWLRDDMKSRKEYNKLHRALHRTCRRLQRDHHELDNRRSDVGVENDDEIGKIVYLDCMTLFCDNSDVPGAITAGRAMPKESYFDEDGLHLSRSGYEVWKSLAESTFGSMLDALE